VVNQVKMGVVDMTLIGTPIWANIVPEFGVFDLGYVFQDYDHMRRAADTAAGKALGQLLVQKAGAHLPALRAPNLAAPTRSRAHPRRARRRDGAQHGHLLRHLRLQDGRHRRRWLRARPGGAQVRPEARRGRGAPVARQLGVDPLHYGIILVIGMGIGLFAPPLGLGLYGACLIGGVKLEETVWPILKYLGLLFLCLLLIAFVPEISTALPRALGY